MPFYLRILVHGRNGRSEAAPSAQTTRRCTGEGVRVFGNSDIRDGKAVVTADTSHLDAEQLKVLAAYQAMQQAMVSADHDAMRDIVEEGTTFTHMSGYTQSKEEFISEVGGPLTYFHSDVREVNVQIDGDWAVLTGVVALTARAYGSEGTFPLNVRQSLHRVNGRWLYSKRA